MEICAISDTLIMDEDGIYNVNDFNDRLLLGLKGTMSEAELHYLKARMRGGLLNKTKRGKLQKPLPIGYI
jgi:DNA invertase Pin-like site-specific DNA recombinase